MNHLLVYLEVSLLVTMSGLCSGLNIALMSLDLRDLKRKARLGNNSAKKVLPFRKNSHLTLASIVFTNVGIISASSLVLDRVYSGLVAGALSTVLIVVFGEVVPQALFSRHALKFCARLTPLLRFMVILTYPISKPLQLLLDKLFASQQVPLHSRRELGLIIGEHLGHNSSELDEDEVEIIRGALQLSKKRVRDITTPVKDVYWLTLEGVIDADKIDEIKTNGWSRIPVLTNDLRTCHGILLMKDLVDINFDGTPVPIESLTLRPTKVIGSMTALDTLFRHFIGARSHMMPVERDDHIVGVVTIEDLIEEIIGHEITDETD